MSATRSRRINPRAIATREAAMSFTQHESLHACIIRVLARSSYYISLLGLKIPLGLLVRSSYAHFALVLITFFVVPLLVYCHISLLPLVREASCGILVWQGVFAIWVTIPLLVVGSVILSHVRAPLPMSFFFMVLFCVLAFHKFAIPAIQPTRAGTILLQIMFTVFEDGSVAGWIWCLYHVVRLQQHVKKSNKCPIEDPKDENDKALIVGNAPTVTDGQPLGREIDRFADVTRFNQYNVNDMPYTGSKVTYHFCNGRNLPEGESVNAVLPLFNASLTHAVYLFMPHMEDARQTVHNLMNSKANVWCVEEERILELRKKIGMNIWQIPTSGMVAIDAFLSKRREVTVHGFNFFAGKKIHYFEESPLQLITSWLERFVTHNPPQEKKWVQGLVKEGRATFLADKHEQTDASVTEKVMEVDGNGKPQKRLRAGLLRTLLKDGVPSQFSI